MVILAPFETFAERGERVRSGEPYSDEFIWRCREKALEYGGMDPVLRVRLLRELQQCVPRHFKEQVFAGIGSFE